MKLIPIIVAIGILLLILVLRSSSEIKSSSDFDIEGPATDADIQRLLQTGRKIDAIKVYRRLHRVGLKEAKDAVDRLAAEMPQLPRE
jgi:ribosomal protein L7/L12